MPQSNDQLADVAAAGGTVYSGKTVVRLKPDGVMDVTNYDAAGVGTRQTNVPWPVNGVLYVKNNGACTGEYPTAAKYNESVTCGNVYVSGTYTQSMTIAARQRRDRPADAGRQAVQQVQRRQHPARLGHRRHARPDRQQLRARRATRSPATPTATASATSTRPTTRSSRTCGSTPRSCRCSTPSSSTTTTAAGSATSRSTAPSRRSTAARWAPATAPARHGLPQGLRLRRPLPVPLPAVLHEPGRRVVGRHPLPRAGSGALAALAAQRISNVPIRRFSLTRTTG